MGHKPPKSAQNIAKNALEKRKKLPPSKRAGTPVGIARARDIANGKELSLDTMKRVASFARHLPAAKKGGSESKAQMAVNLWGGTSFVKSAKNVVDRMEKKKKKK